MHTHTLSRRSSADSLRRPNSRRPRRRVAVPVLGQWFDIDVERRAGGWLIRIPEIDAVTYSSRRAEVEFAARECIAERTGIPMGYIVVRIRD
ncbi:long chain fatty acid-CoA synthetase [Mycobacterium sp. Lab-001]|uniref:long chain fatty acid-CoA synthetase n=1 Tax=Mycobacterium sp. Lab-001 TaxID=3410136 RepID=UPI003D179539